MKSSPRQTLCGCVTGGFFVALFLGVGIIAVALGLKELIDQHLNAKHLRLAGEDLGVVCGRISIGIIRFHKFLCFLSIFSKIYFRNAEEAG